MPNSKINLPNINPKGLDAISIGDITTRRKPARSNRVNSMKIEDHKDVRMVALYEGPMPKGGLKPVNVNRLSRVTCIVR